jgi:hypothetical protein
MTSNSPAQEVLKSQCPASIYILISRVLHVLIRLLQGSIGHATHDVKLVWRKFSKVSALVCLLKSIYRALLRMFAVLADLPQLVENLLQKSGSGRRLATSVRSAPSFDQCRSQSKQFQEAASSQTSLYLTGVSTSESQISCGSIPTGGLLLFSAIPGPLPHLQPCNLRASRQPN